MNFLFKINLNIGQYLLQSIDLQLFILFLIDDLM